MAPGTTEGPSPPPESESRLQEWIDFVRCSRLIGLVRSVELPTLIQYALRLPPPPGDAAPPTPIGYGTRLAGHARIAPPLGLADILIIDPTPKASDARPPRAAVDSADDNERLALLAALGSGSPLVEVFAVSADFPFVGDILIFDGCSCKTVYRRGDWGGEYRKFFSKKKKWLSSDAGRHPSLFEDKLLLNGPSQCISIYGGILIALDIPETKRKPREIRELRWDAEEDLSMYGKPRTRTILTNRGRVHVTCAVVTRAADAYLQVMLRLRCESSSTVRASMVHGHITARIDTFEIGCTLFSKDVDEAVHVSAVSEDSLPQGNSGELCQPVVLPLDRSVIAVPVGGCVQVKGELVFNGSTVVSVDHSIPIEGERIQSQWVQDNYCHTSVHIIIRANM